jgi:hypothetical protein
MIICSSSHNNVIISSLKPTFASFAPSHNSSNKFIAKWLFSPNRIDGRMAAMAEEQRRQPPRMSQMMRMRRSTIIMGTGHRHPKMSIENSAMTPCFPPHFLIDCLFICYYYLLMIFDFSRQLRGRKRLFSTFMFSSSADISLNQIYGTRPSAAGGIRIKLFSLIIIVRVIVEIRNCLCYFFCRYV